MMAVYWISEPSHSSSEATYASHVMGAGGCGRSGYIVVTTLGIAILLSLILKSTGTASGGNVRQEDVGMS